MSDVTLKSINSELPDTPTVSQIGRKSPASLRDLLDHHKSEIKNDLNCVMVGTIKTFYPADQTADIRLNILTVLKQAQGLANNQIADVTLPPEKLPLLQKVPVVMIGGGDINIIFPIQQGDTCIVFFCDKDIDNWWTTGTLMPPNTDRTHSVCDGIALVGIYSLAKLILNYSTNQMQIRHRQVSPYYLEPIVKIDGAIDMGQMIAPPLDAKGGTFYWNHSLNNWYGYKIIGYTPTTPPVPIYGWVAFT